MIWIFTESEGDGIKSRLPFINFSTFIWKQIFFKILVKFPLLCGDRDETLPKIKFTNNSSDTSCRGTDESEDLVDVERFSKASYISALL